MTEEKKDPTGLEIFAVIVLIVIVTLIMGTLSGLGFNAAMNLGGDKPQCFKVINEDDGIVKTSSVDCK